MHCMSEKYLIEDLEEEYRKSFLNIVIDIFEVFAYTDSKNSNVFNVQAF